MTETLPGLLLRLSEAGDRALLWGRVAAAYAEQDIERLCDRRVLVEQELRDEWAPCPDCDCGADSRSIVSIGERRIAACPFDHRSDTVLKPEDLRSFLIVPDALVREVAAGAGMPAPPQPVADGLWHLRATSTGQEVFLALTVPAVLQTGAIAIIRQTARGAPVTLLGPKLDAADRLRLDDAGIHHVETALALDSSGPASRFLLDLAKLAPAAEAAKLSMRQSTGEVSMAGITLTLSHQTAAVFRELVDAARSGRSLVTHQQIEGSTGRESKDLIRELRAAFDAAGMAESGTKKLIVAVHGRGYRLALQPSEISVRP